ncbi:3-deoxy-manno-octulosonate cytidylyltransferase [Luteimonas fraxinea]|uniref:3-deoxy-manno-octulosonate cytidylyltransferase n=1 Tax=Luteimonas fraxinea TaxID=2901869 RepID=A0ABS8UDG6_9GAMM|nr:3-deoxy-manno-octulosonate cytidylyltransferase [Luteimonas fraxinea]MCD9097094.1 3-deoxy-manno-octulosonate cytidylyltransferase [Luteimonas fraxinea]MCD9126635.1 3-deoxy-manno-octulosonate cytidylyltransferase [Luteimonas fraxinea]UHH09600.1 3-deoxy-manno-octulosonate cytidylyltransferase [Luteimonas fraxinea]
MSTSTGFVVAIPARYASTRLPGKPLQLLGGEPLVLHVARRALAAGAGEVWVATDDTRVRDALAGTAVQVAMTSPDHPSGTDRLAECAALAGWDDTRVVVNLQGDEPFAPVSGIQAVAELASQQGVDLATLCVPVEDVETLLDPNAVKVVRGAQGDALYFSRAPVPWPRDAFARSRDVMPEGDWWRHIGIYGYRVGFLKQFAAMPPGRLEQIEMLEQLRVLEAGHRVAVGIAAESFPPGVDTPEDLARAEARLAAGG